MKPAKRFAAFAVSRDGSKQFESRLGRDCFRLVAVLVVLMCAIHMDGLKASPLFTERITVNPKTGAEPDGSSGPAVLSANGCIVVFQSGASNFADPSFGIKTSSPPQIYAVDRCVTPHTMELISVTNDGTTAANGYCEFPNVSTDGRYVAFYSYATNLPLPGGSGNGGVIFIRDRVAQTTSSPLASWRSSAETYTNAGKPYMSADGKYLTLDFVATGVPHNVYRFDLSMSPPTLEPACPTAAMASSGACENPVISADGGTIVFDTSYGIVSSDTNAADDVYTYQVHSALWQLASINADGSLGNGDVDHNGLVALSADGQIVVFHNYNASSLIGGSRTLLIKNMTSGELTIINADSQGDVEPMDPPTSLSVSLDGARVAFTPNTVYPLVHSGLDALVFDTPTKRLVSMCESSQAVYGDGDCQDISISGDGNWATYTSYSTNLVPGITNTTGNIFVSAIAPALDLIFASEFE